MIRPPPLDGCMSGRIDNFRDDPAVFADHPIAGEAELIEGRQRAMEEEPSWHGSGGLGVSLDASASHRCDEFERPGEGVAGHPLSAVAGSYVVAANAPVRERFLRGLVVLASVLDPHHFGGWP